LAYLLLGPWLGFFTVATVVTVQALVFHDGGITALGANVLNMAIIDGVVGYLIYKAVIRALGNNRKARLLGAFLAGWAGITAAGIAAGIEIGLSPSFPYGVAITVPVMGSWHALLGMIEGIITTLVIDYLYERRSPLVLLG
jgi:cobalt/nickel transport system permease protein